MDCESRSQWGRLRCSVRTRVLSGILVLIPLGFTFRVLRFLYNLTAGALAPLVSELSGPLPATFPAPSDVFMQALVGIEWTNLDVMRVR